MILVKLIWYFMLKIRLSKSKSKNNLYYKIVVIDSRKSKNSKFIEKVGFFNEKNKLLYINNNRVFFWIKNGAKLSDKVKYLINK
ncbi:30S ribosomal protein S16 [endosymbiont of Pachyrhynchus infernalis]|uniref:30S ribosomal protein S16 n=1 Tax=endosymbiont of Pachyrhynchus infernalis TaxID=1971488 RepID=UPI000DC6E627|nr:30S ribosomal protein S16 [endosymbiont of Pachyrhynchus infernalis]BBA84882.1 30S ribosomal protein S16 [endosymbiont of Pachyrhynchus infernalis]